MARLLAAVNSVSYLLFSTIGIPNVERWGRRKMLMYASAGQCFCYLVITVLIRYSMLPGYEHQTEVAKASVAFFFLYYVFFGIGMQGVPWLYPAGESLLVTWLNYIEADNPCRDQLAVHEKQGRRAGNCYELAV